LKPLYGVDHDTQEKSITEEKSIHNQQLYN